VVWASGQAGRRECLAPGLGAADAAHGAALTRRVDAETALGLAGGRVAGHERTVIAHAASAERADVRASSAETMLSLYPASRLH
jgi:hypothetical protein